MPSADDGGIVAPEVRGLDAFARTMETWLAARIEGATDIVVHTPDYPRGAGLSHETILFDATWRQGGTAHRQGMVVRIKPVRHRVYQDDMFEAQWRLMRLAGAHGVRVPRVLWAEDDAAVLGAPFFVMERVAGRVAVSRPPYSREGWLAEATPDARRRMWEDAIAQLAAVQAIPVDAASFLALPPADGADGDPEVGRWQRYLDWIDPDASLDLLRRCLARLVGTYPTGAPAGIVWGDARLGNMIVDDDFRVAAVIDWEQPSLGGALHDLGWWLFSDHVQTAMHGLARLDGMGTRDETIARWSALTGKSAAAIDWFEHFAAFRMDCLAVRMATLRGGGAGGTPGRMTADLIGLA